MMTDAEKMSEAAALMPCPFCGGRKITVFDNSVLCDSPSCGASGPDLGHCCGPACRAESITAWNTRAPVDASEPAADCQQAELVTVDAGLLDEVKRLRRALNESMETLAEVKRNMWRDASGQCDRDEFLNRKIVQRITAAIAASRAALARLEREVG